VSTPNQPDPVDEFMSGPSGHAPHTASPTAAPHHGSWTPTKRHWDAMTWATVVNAVCTLVALVVAVWLGLRSMRVAEDTLRTTAESLRQSNLATIYGLGSETTKFIEANPQLSRFFDKTHRRPDMTDEELWQEFKKLPEDQQIVVDLGCDRIADFMQVAFVQRSVLPADEWNKWWSYFADQYDESPILRGYLVKRAAWFAFTDAIKPENRAAYYRGPETK
jgi:hypothetical protein